MAKSKLSIQLSQALSNVKTTLAGIQKTMEKDKKVKPEEVDKLGNQWDALARASSAMSRHLESLRQRETSPNVPDRLRNLKNIFKNKEELKQQRAVTRQWYENVEKKISKLWAESRQAVHDANAEKAQPAVRRLSTEIASLEAGLASHYGTVDAIETALL